MDKGASFDRLGPWPLLSAVMAGRVPAIHALPTGLKIHHGGTENTEQKFNHQ